MCKPGDRVAYAGPIGGYAETRLIAADRLVKLPASIGFEEAAAMMLQGMTARMLLRSVYPVAAGDTILVHAAAGGVGLILCQWAAALGAIVIGTVSTDDKAELARRHGCHHPIVYTRQDFVAEVDSITAGAKLPVVYDSVGRDTFLKSLDCLRPRGLMVTFGQSSGADRTVLAERPAAEGLAVPDPADAVQLHRQPRRARSFGGRIVRDGRLRARCGSRSASASRSSRRPRRIAHWKRGRRRDRPSSRSSGTRFAVAFPFGDPPE